MSEVRYPDAPLQVYVPADPDRPVLAIEPGSGIVGGRQFAPEGRLAVDYEGNVYQTPQFARFASRVHHAAGRHSTNYPTVARAWAKAEDLVCIGEFNESSGEVIIYGDEERGLLCRWLGVDELDADELQAEGARFEMRREIIAARASGNPALRFAADQMQRHYGVEI
jgi:hypothetical protein